MGRAGALSAARIESKKRRAEQDIIVNGEKAIGKARIIREERRRDR